MTTSGPDTPEGSADRIRSLFDLTSKVAFVTGAGGVLGGLLARALAVYGADVVVTDRALAALEPVEAGVQALGRRCVALAGDVTDESQVRAVFDKAVTQMGKVDILITAAGVVNRFPAEDYPVAEWDRLMAVNVRGTFLCCQAAGRHMIGRGGGKIVTVGSVRGFVGSPGGNAGYATSKGAVHILTRQLATEWARYRINVNSIAPAVFPSPLTRDVLGNPESTRWLLSRIPWGRPAQAADMIGAVIYLASAASDFVTGAILPVDGGSVAG